MRNRAGANIIFKLGLEGGTRWEKTEQIAFTPPARWLE